jgi:hypothetical protein
MARPLTYYIPSSGYDVIDGLAVADPAFLDTAILRIVQDAELVAYVIARARGQDSIDDSTVNDVAGVLGAQELVAREDSVSDELTEYYARQWVGPYLRSGMPITYDGLLALARLPAAVVTHVLPPAAAASRERSASALTSSSIIPFCGDLPFPLNQWLC